MLALVLLAVLAPSGQSIYRTGATAGGEITAAMAGGEVRISATAVPCTNCHGADGRGSSEGGIVSPDIRWQSLARPYSVNANGRARGPYTKKLLVRAISMGIDSSGNPLAPVMPRFAMSAAQMAELIGYLEALDTKPVPGVNETRIRIGVIAPHDALTTLQSFFARQSVYGRRIEVVPADAQSLRTFINERDVLAIAPAFGADEALARVADEEEIPMLTAMSAHPPNSSASFRWTRDLFGGVDEQAKVLERFAVQQQFGAEAVVSIENGRPVLHAGSRTFIALPTSIHDVTVGDAPSHPTQLAALAAASLLLDALERAGRDVTRASLLRAINTTRDLQTGYAPPFTFGANRGIGSLGAWVVETTAREPRAVWVP